MPVSATSSLKRGGGTASLLPIPIVSFPQLSLGLFRVKFNKSLGASQRTHPLLFSTLLFYNRAHQ